MATVKNNVANFEAECFIIPNPSCMISDLCSDHSKDRITALSRDLCKRNGMEFDPEKDRLVEVWFASEDIECDNMVDHLFTFLDTVGNGVACRLPTMYVPAKIFAGHKEGDVIDVNYKVSAAVHEWSISKGTYRPKVDENGKQVWEDFLLEMKLKLNQSRYRYRSYAPFENALSLVGAGVEG